MTDEENIWDDDEVASDARPSNFAKLKGHLSGMQFNVGNIGGGPSPETKQLFTQLSQEAGTPRLVRSIDRRLRGMSTGFKRAEGTYQTTKMGLKYNDISNLRGKKPDIPAKDDDKRLGAGSAASAGGAPADTLSGAQLGQHIPGKGVEPMGTVYQGEVVEDVTKAPGSTIYGGRYGGGRRQLNP